MLMLAEEASEVSVATLHCLRKTKKETLSNLAEEITDLKFMLEEIIYYLQNEKTLVSIKNTDNLRTLTSVSFLEAIALFRKQKEINLIQMLGAS